MILKPVNLSTGPVGITKEVQSAFQELPFSSRTRVFKEIFNSTTQLLNQHFNVQETFLLSGSGTLANEAMLQEIKALPGTGFILSNGEFGNRLIKQAKAICLQPHTYQVGWGEDFSLKIIKALIIRDKPSWILFCHCETSTGVINDLHGIATIARENNVKVFVDCMSTAGTTPLDLSKVSMASASSGKGLASVPGIAIVFSNIETQPKTNTPVYLDLHHYHLKKGVPFTISSNLVKALYVSTGQKLNLAQYQLASTFRKRIFNILNNHELVPFNNISSPVFTIVNDQSGLLHAIKRKVVVSYESDYLKERQWWQLASFGFYTMQELDNTCEMLESLVLKKTKGHFILR